MKLGPDLLPGRRVTSRASVFHIYGTGHVILKNVADRTVFGGFPTGIQFGDDVFIDGCYENRNRVREDRFIDYGIDPRDSIGYMYVEMLPSVSLYTRGSNEFTDSGGWAYPWYRLGQEHKHLCADFWPSDELVHFGRYGCKPKMVMDLVEFLSTHKRVWPNTKKNPR